MTAWNKLRERILPARLECFLKENYVKGVGENDGKMEERKPQEREKEKLRRKNEEGKWGRKKGRGE